MLVLHEGCLSNSSQLTKASRLRMGKRWRGDIAKTADLKWQKVYFVWHPSCLVIKAGEGEAESGVLVMKVLVFPSNCYAYWGPASQNMGEYHLLMGSREKFSSFASAWPSLSLFLSLNYFLSQSMGFSFVHRIFSPCSSMRSEKAVWWSVAGRKLFNHHTAMEKSLQKNIQLHSLCRKDENIKKCRL